MPKKLCFRWTFGLLCCVRQSVFATVVLLVCFTSTALLQAQGQQPAVEKLPEIIKRVQPSTVVVLTYDETGKPISQGSGFFVSRTGNIISNRHVLEGASRAEIKTAQGKVYPITHIIAEDKQGDLVLAGVNIPTGSAEPLKLSKSIPLVGQRIVVIGNPLGFEGTVSDGIVSAVRDIPAFGKIIQLSAPISHGSSGSPVIDMKGQVIGIATFLMAEGQNLNFAIPSQRADKLKPGKPRALAEWQNRQIPRQVNLSTGSDTKWRSYELDGNSTIWFPAKWKGTLINKVTEEESLDEEKMYVSFQELIEVGCDLYFDNPLFISISRVFLVDQGTGRQKIVREEALDEFEQVIAEGLQELPEAKILSSPTKTWMGTRKLISRKYAFMSGPLEITCTVYVFIAKDNIYTVSVATGNPEADIGLNLLVKQIITLWDFSESPRRNSSVPIALEHINLLHNTQAYHNPRWHFSLTTPSDWEKIPATRLKEYVAVIQETTKSSYDYLAAFQKRSDQYFSHPYAIIQLTDTQGQSPAVLEELFSSAEYEQVVKEATSKVGQTTKDFAPLPSANIAGIDKDRHIVFIDISQDVVEFGKIKGISATFIGRNAMVSLHFYALQQDFESCKKRYFDQIIDSFEYDQGYEFPDSNTSHYSQGLAFAKQKKYAEAVKAFRQAIRIKPDDANAQYYLGLAYSRLGRYTEAILAYKQGIRLRPDFAKAHYGLGVAYGKSRRYTEAIAAFKQTIRIKPDDAKAHYGLGTAYFRVGDKGSALDQYRILKDLDKERANKLFNLIYK